MASFVDNNVKSYEAGEAIGAYIRVKKSGDTVVAAGVGEIGIGVTLANVALGDAVTVRLFNGYGTVFMVAAGAITKNAAVYPLAAGKTDDAQDGTAGGAPIGYAEEAATASGDVIEVLLRGHISSGPLASASQAAVVTTAPTNTTPYGFSTSAQAAALVTLVNQIRSDLITAGIIKGAA